MSSGDDGKIALHELGATNLQTFLNHFGSILVNAVAVGIGKNVVDDTAFVRRGTVLA